MATITRETPIKEQIVKWRNVCVRTPLIPSTKTSAISAREAATTMLRVYCSWPGASLIINRLPSKRFIDR